MKRISLWIPVLVFCFCISGLAFAQDDIQKHLSCKYCGMDREKFAHSRVLIQNDDGTTVGTCSLHCAAIELAINIDKTIKVIEVGDYYSKNLIDVEKAFWVIGGNKMGVMTRRAKWAFEKKEDAEKFQAENNGDLATYDQAIKAVYEDMYQDTQMIREKRKMSRTMKEHKH